MVKRMSLGKWYRVRWQIMERDNFTCQYCGQSAPDVKLEVDHKLALADGGTNDLSNLVTSCYACNRGKESLRFSVVAPTIKAGARPTQNNIRELLKDGAMTSIDIATKLNIKIPNARVAIHRLMLAGEVTKIGKEWGLTD